MLHVALRLFTVKCTISQAKAVEDSAVMLIGVSRACETDYQMLIIGSCP